MVRLLSTHHSSSASSCCCSCVALPLSARECPLARASTRSFDALPPHALIYPRVYLPRVCYPLTYVACMRWRLTAAAGVVSFFRGLGRGGQLLVLALLAVVLVEVRSDQMMMSAGASYAASYQHRLVRMAAAAAAAAAAACC